MKNLQIIPLFVLLLIGVNANAQGTFEDERDKLHLGVKAGVNFSNAYNAVQNNFDPRTRAGFVGGGFLAIPMGKWLGLQPEVLFSQKGTNATGTYNGEAYDMKRTTNSIDVPLFLTVKPIRFITIMAGPQMSFLTKQKDRFASESSSLTVEQDFENQDLRRATFGLVTGVDVHIFNFVVSGRAGWDMQNNSTDRTTSGEVPTYKNAWGQITLGFRIF